MSETTGERVRKLREAAGIDRPTMAKRLGLSPEGYGHYERSRTPFNEEHLRAISKMLKVPMVHLLGEADAEKLEEDEVRIWWTGTAPHLKPVARAALKALYDASDLDEQIREKHAARAVFNEAAEKRERTHKGKNNQRAV